MTSLVQEWILVPAGEKSVVRNDTLLHDWDDCFQWYQTLSSLMYCRGWLSPVISDSHLWCIAGDDCLQWYQTLSSLMYCRGWLSPVISDSHLWCIAGDDCLQWYQTLISDVLQGMIVSSDIRLCHLWCIAGDDCLQWYQTLSSLMYCRGWLSPVISDSVISDVLQGMIVSSDIRLCHLWCIAGDDCLQWYQTLLSLMYCRGWLSPVISDSVISDVLQGMIVSSDIRLSSLMYCRGWLSPVISDSVISDVLQGMIVSSDIRLPVISDVLQGMIVSSDIRLSSLMYCRGWLSPVISDCLSSLMYCRGWLSPVISDSHLWCIAGDDCLQWYQTVISDVLQGMIVSGDIRLSSLMYCRGWLSPVISDSVVSYTCACGTSARVSEIDLSQPRHETAFCWRHNRPMTSQLTDPITVPNYPLELIGIYVHINAQNKESLTQICHRSTNVQLCLIF